MSGLFIFQALMMVGMYQGDYWKAVRKTFFAETVSMNFVMAGMIPVMLILASRWESSMEPQNAAFWFRMSIASIVGGVLAYPINYWLVANHLKHGCMTLPSADGPAPGLGHMSSEPSQMAIPKGMAMGEESGKGMKMAELSTGRALLWIAGTFAVMLIAVWLTTFVVPVVL